MLCLVAEWLNKIAGRHWKEFAAQNYFDKNGVFISLFLSFPIVMIALGIMVKCGLGLCAWTHCRGGVCVLLQINAFISASRLLIVVKREELKRKAQRSATTAGATSDQSNSKKTR